MIDPTPPEGVYRQPTVFTVGDTDSAGRVRSDALLSRLQHAAEAHHGFLGLDRDAAVAHGCFWAVVRTELHMDAPLPAGEELWLDTWAGRRGHGLFWRHNRLLGPAGEVLLRAVSVWVLMDLESRTLGKNHAWCDGFPQADVPGALPETLRGLPFPKELSAAGCRTVTEAESDINGHLNNALYIPWGEALLPEDYAGRHRMRTLWIEYRKELPKGQNVELYSRLENDILYARGLADGRESFCMRLEYDPI